ncbi:MAG: gamma-glutamyl-gamma-aminobutyrate hydrolase family protein [Caldilineae bacterium]|nr:MAG: gamma-glutamyl-gamma-aminobutyrate hydrolase family protein [Caldilineae bacterium]
MPGGTRPVIAIPLNHSRSDRGYDIYGYRPTYVRALHMAGAAPLMLPLDLDEAAYRAVFARVDGVFLGGGEDIAPDSYAEPPHASLGPTDRERDRVEMLLARWAVQEQKPLLGVCRGHQVINVALGGSMHQDVSLITEERHDFRGNGYPRDYLPHTVLLDPTSRLAQILGRKVWVNSLHHQAVNRLGSGVRAVGVTPAGVVEAIEIPEHPFALGVQWHPEELIGDARMLGLFQAFVRACACDIMAHPIAMNTYDASQG